MDFDYIGDCIFNPFVTLENLERVIDNAKEITKRTLLKHCDVDLIVRSMMSDFPKSYTYWKSSYKGSPVYYFEWSRTEYFYMRR